jgi:hypothetical protein
VRSSHQSLGPEGLIKVGSRSAYTRILKASCVLVLSIIAVAGLWPFHAPPNRVTWLDNENGLQFAFHGTAISSGVFRSGPKGDQDSCSLEIWLQAERLTGDSSILAMDGSVDARQPFLLRQYDTSLAIQRHFVDESGLGQDRWLKIDNVFHQGKSVFVTITSSGQKTSVYLNGAIAATSASAGMIGRDLTGRLVLANSTVNDSWTGQIMGLALYRKELTAVEVTRHFESWTWSHRPVFVGDESPQAVYLFDERAGITVYNQVDSATDIIIPRNYYALHPAFLNPTWVQYSRPLDFWMRRNVWRDLGLNIAGFIPVGFIFMAYFCSVGRHARSVPKVILLGFGLSLIIETLQFFLPSRDSGMTDLLTNTAGTALGIVLHRQSSVQKLLARIESYAAGTSESSAKAATGIASGPDSGGLSLRA